MKFDLVKKAFFFVALLLSSAQIAAAIPAQGLLYSFARQEGKTHYLLATMHTDDEKVLAMATKAQPYIQAADRVVQEMTPDMASVLAAAGNMLMPGKQTLADLVEPQLLQKVKQLAQKKHLPVAGLIKMKPWAVAVTLGTPLPRSDVLDQVIYKTALKQHKAVYGLETASEQLAVFDGLSQSQQLRMLSEVVTQEAQLEAQFQAMKDAYLRGDLVGLQEISLMYEAAGDADLAEWFREKLINERNDRMMQRLQVHLQAGAVFVAVGALHLPGERGLLSQLQQAGYEIHTLW